MRVVGTAPGDLQQFLGHGVVRPIRQGPVTGIAHRLVSALHRGMDGLQRLGPTQPCQSGQQGALSGCVSPLQRRPQRGRARGGIGDLLAGHPYGAVRRVPLLARRCLAQQRHQRLGVGRPGHDLQRQQRGQTRRGVRRGGRLQERRHEHRRTAGERTADQQRPLGGILRQQRQQRLIGPRGRQQPQRLAGRIPDRHRLGRRGQRCQGRYILGCACGDERFERRHLHRRVGVLQRLQRCGTDLRCPAAGQAGQRRDLAGRGQAGHRRHQRAEFFLVWQLPHTVRGHRLPPRLTRSQAGDDQADRLVRFGDDQPAQGGRLGRRRIGRCQRFADRHRRRVLALGAQRFHRRELGIEHGAAQGFRGLGGERLQRLGRRHCADASQRDHRRLPQLDAVLRQQGRNGHGGVRVRQTAERNHHAHLRTPLGLAQHLTQRRGRGRAAQPFQRVARHVRQPGVGQQRGQRRHAAVRPDDRQLPAGVVLGHVRRVPLQHAHQTRLQVRTRRRILAGRVDGQLDRLKRLQILPRFQLPQRLKGRVQGGTVHGGRRGRRAGHRQGGDQPGTQPSHGGRPRPVPGGREEGHDAHRAGIGRCGRSCRIVSTRHVSCLRERCVVQV